MALEGFLCPLDGSKVGFEVCIHQCRTRCIELPVLVAMMEERVKKDNVFSVTELNKPPRITAWERKNPYWLDPFSMIWSTFGTAFHAMIEAQRGPIAEFGSTERYTFEKENYFEYCMEVRGVPVVLRGTPDQYEWTSHVLTDYKTLKWFWDLYYLVEKGEWSGSSYHWQLNTYRRFKFPDCKRMQIQALVKDWNRKLRNEKGCPPIVRLEVPWIEDEVIDLHVEKSIGDILEAIEDITKARDCTDEERWKGNIRCKEFCVVAGDCPQYNDETKELKLK